MFLKENKSVILILNKYKKFINFCLLLSQHVGFQLKISHCVTTEKVPAKYRSLKMAEASLGK